MLRSSVCHCHLETSVVELSSRKYFVEPLQRREVRRGGDHLKDAPANDGVGVEHDGAGSLSQGDPVTAAQQVTEIGTDQEAVGGPACGFV
jgi:hypothetical protein